MPRIAFIDYFPTHYRKRLYEEVAKRMDADFYFFADERERYWNRKIPVINDGAYRTVERRRYRVAGQAVMPGVAASIAGGRYDAVIKSLNGKLMMPMVYAAAKARGVPFVLWSGMWYHPETRVHRLSLPLTEGVYRGADAIVTYGEHVKRFILQTPGVAEEKVFVAGQAVNGERFEGVRPSMNGNGPEILYIGQFEERKGLRYLFEAFDRLPSGAARLRLIGNGTQEDWVRQEVDARPGAELVGYRSQEELPGELKRSTCLVLPSITTPLDKEPWGLVVNEAMHASLPVVATDAVGAAVGGLVRDGHNGYVVPERDSVALGAALERLVTDREAARRMGEVANEDVKAFNHARMAEAFVAGVNYGLERRR